MSEKNPLAQLGGAAPPEKIHSFENAFEKPAKPRTPALLEKCHTLFAPGRNGGRNAPEPERSRMEPRPQADPNCPWQLLRLRAKILHDDIRKAREQLTLANGDRTRIARLERAQRAQERAVHALSVVIYLDASISTEKPLS
jgi:hypothetical protein